jgi:hypothetical protein
LRWEGSEIKIIRRTQDTIEHLTQVYLEEKAYPPGCNIYADDPPSPDKDMPPPALPGQKRGRQAPTPPTTPSSGTKHVPKRTRMSGFELD